MSNGYARLKNDFWHSPKIMRALAENPAAIGYYVAGISYASDNLTDGHLSETAVCYAMRVPDEIIDWLEDEGFWECLEDGGWMIHGYLEHQNSREKIEHARKKDAQRKRATGDREDGIRTESERNPNGIRSDLTQNPKPKTQNPSDSSYEESHTTRVREEDGIRTESERNPNGIRSDLTQNPKPKTQNPSDSSYEESHTTRVRESEEDNPLTATEQGYFDHFWDLYPKKQGKRDAMFAFKRALRRAHGATAIIAGVTRFAQDPNRPPDGDRYLRSPKNWLEGDCWKDTNYTPTATRTPAQPSKQQQNLQHNLDLVRMVEAQERGEAIAELK
ncbi:hypothetical protein BCUN_0615 [Bifidobacterium cuniculi]|uniref:Uncharacterized protein n=1 Tax=Bifidobacterium cuniculi TaxID=1688 RepID=A0A087B511_9BIFI|nr:hypothetical protein [Bifidobacterium cuniculi]KFI66111.1 hypothetical protein BCUN_0615 [Bifidobacterium cuniculi]